MTDAEHQPGDIVNGHMLGSDGVWRPIASGPPPPQQVVMRLDPSSYWARYLRRWFPTVGGIAGLLFVMAVLGGDDPGMGMLLLSFLCVGIPVGTVLNFLVASFPSPKSKSNPPATGG